MKVSQSCPTLCDPMDYSLPGSFVHGILQARLHEWVAVPFSRGFPSTGIEPGSPALQVDSLPAERPGKSKYGEEGNGNSLQYSCLKNPTDREAWQGLVHGLARRWT